MQQNHLHSRHSVGHSLFVSGIFLLLFFITLASPVNSRFSYAIGADVILKLSNQAREQQDVADLSTNSTLMSAAQAKAEDMVANHYFAHFSPSGKTPWDFFKDAGYTYKVAGENLAITNEDEAAVVNGWLNSPAHRENLLSTQYNDVGIGIAPFGDYNGHKNTIVVVALYGSQAPVASFTGSETTNPAGTITALEPALAGKLLYGAIGAASALIIAGIAVELRHIKRHEHQKWFGSGIAK